MTAESRRTRRVRSGGAWLAAASLMAPAAAHASFLSGEALDTFANALAWFVLIVMPLVALGLFWYVHILPEVIAEKRHHPQKDSIKVLCILSLFFGGLLWPFAWLWAYTRPVAFRAAYGTERHEDYYTQMGEKARRGELVADEIAHLRAELATMAARGTLPPELRKLRDDLEALSPAPAAADAHVSGGN
jgi:CBS domain containing-hemolysin-like protein